jgi:hypothetical protein
MNNLLLKILAILSVFLGEILAIYAETFSIKYNFLSSGFWKLFVIICIGGFFLILGYILGFKSFNNLWIVTVVSITTLLIAEPLVITLILNQTPTTGAIIGFILGILGLLATLFL